LKRRNGKKKELERRKGNFLVSIKKFNKQILTWSWQTMKHTLMFILYWPCEMSTISFFYGNETGHDRIGSFHPK
jgi:hypothetical protein